MKKFVLRHWRGNGSIIPDIMKDVYYDYPKHSMNRNARSYKLSECIYKVISEEEYLKEILDKYGIESHNKAVRKNKLGDNKLLPINKE